MFKKYVIRISDRREFLDMFKGIFWYCDFYAKDEPEANEIISVMVKCDANGVPLEKVNFSSKSGENFNHKVEWVKFKHLNSYPYNYFPRGRVEIKNGKIKIFANPYIIASEQIKNMIVSKFELETIASSIYWIADNSYHYQYSYREG